MEITNLHKRIIDLASFDVEDDEGENKLLPLREAISRYVKPSMMIYAREGSYAAIREIIRHFRGYKPEFILVMISCRDYGLDLIHCGLVSKILTSRCFESTTQAVSPIIRRAYKEKCIKIENWSFLSLTQRLMAGAMRIEFMPTRSLLQSSMAQENKDSFIEIDDPFGGSDKLGLVKSLNPDIALVHGWASDRNGNLILAPSILTGEGEWGALGTKHGVIATVEEIVSTKFIREHSFLVKIPGYFVKSVSKVPFGAHPIGLASVSDDFDAYEADYQFMKDHGQTSKEYETLETWLNTWVMACSNNEDYLRKLGHARLAFLKGKACKSDWKYKLSSLPEKLLETNEYSSEDMMVIAASRIIKEKVLKNEYRVILSGIGTAGMAGWLAYYQLKKEGVDVELMLGSGEFGWAPRPGEPQVTNLSNLRTCKMVGDNLHNYGIFAHKQCICVLGAAQIDKYGNINSTKLSEDSYLVGSGGANDALAAAKETIVVLIQSKKRFVSELAYRTCFGKNTTTVVSDKAVFTKIESANELILTGFFPSNDRGGQENSVREIMENCGWELKVHQNVTRIDPPDDRELVLLRLLSSKPENS